MENYYEAMNYLFSKVQEFVSEEGDEDVFNQPPPVDDQDTVIPKKKNSRVDLLLDQLQNATLLSERQQAVDGLMEVAETYKTDMGQGGIRILLDALVTDPRDTELINTMLDLVQILVTDHSENAAIIAGDVDLVKILLSLLENENTWIRGPTAGVLNQVLKTHTNIFSATLLQCHEGLRRLLAVLNDRRDHIRDLLLQILMTLTEGNKELQQYMVFEDAITKLFEIIQLEGAEETSITAVDCLVIIKNVVTGNEMTQRMFLENNSLPLLDPCLVLPSDANDETLSSNRVAFLCTALDILQQLAPMLPSYMRQQNQLLETIALIACSSSILLARAQLRALDLLSMLLKANADVQMLMMNTVLQSYSKLAVTALMELELNPANDAETQTSVSHLLDTIYQSDVQRMVTLQHIFNEPPPMMDENGAEYTLTPPGKVLLKCLSTNLDSTQAEIHVTWRACRRFISLLSDSKDCKELALRIPSDSAAGFFTRCVSWLHKSIKSDLETKTNQPSLSLIQIALFRLVIAWMNEFPKAVDAFLASTPTVIYFLDLLADETTDTTRPRSSSIDSTTNQSTYVQLQALSALLLGLGLQYGSTTSTRSPKSLLDLIYSRVGLEQFMACMSKAQGTTPFLKATAMEMTLFPSLTAGSVYEKPFVVFFQHSIDQIQQVMYQLYANERRPEVPVTNVNNQELIEAKRRIAELEQRANDAQEALRKAETSLLEVPELDEELRTQHRDLLLLLANQEIQCMAFRKILEQKNGLEAVNEALELSRTNGAIDI